MCVPALAVTVSPLITPVNVTLHVAFVPPSYVLLLAVTVGVSDLAVTSNVLLPQSFVVWLLSPATWT